MRILVLGLKLVRRFEFFHEILRVFNISAGSEMGLSNAGV